METHAGVRLVHWSRLRLEAVVQSFNKRLKERFLPVVKRWRFPEHRLLEGGRGNALRRRKGLMSSLNALKKNKKDIKSQNVP